MPPLMKTARETTVDLLAIKKKSRETVMPPRSRDILLLDGASTLNRVSFGVIGLVLLVGKSAQDRESRQQLTFFFHLCCYLI